MIPNFDRALLRKTVKKLKRIGDGIDPITGFEYDDYTLFFLKENRELFIDAIVFLSILDGISNDKFEAQKPFYITEDDLDWLEPSPEILTITQFTDYVNSIVSRPGMGKLRPTQITNWLVDRKILHTITDEQKRVRVVTEAGQRIGITSVKRTSDNGISYYLNVYSTRAQRYLIDNLIYICGGDDIPF